MIQDELVRQKDTSGGACYGAHQALGTAIVFFLPVAGGPGIQEMTLKVPHLRERSELRSAGGGWRNLSP